VHVAEDLADVEDAKRRGYAGPFERLLTLGALPAGSILAHGVHLDAAQVRQAAAAGLWLVQNPRSNEGNRVGYPGALAESSNVAVGTDGYPADMTVEHAALERLAREHADAGLARLGERIGGGARLARERFGDDAITPPPIAPEELERIRRRAREEAARLWPRMLAQ
ncbi:MAG TPA: hypothetical protein VF316_03490, partial [Polyangiaceae bacterium]